MGRTSPKEKALRDFKKPIDSAPVAKHIDDLQRRVKALQRMARPNKDLIIIAENTLEDERIKAETYGGIVNPFETASSFDYLTANHSAILKALKGHYNLSADYRRYSLCTLLDLHRHAGIRQRGKPLAIVVYPLFYSRIRCPLSNPPDRASLDELREHYDMRVIESGRRTLVSTLNRMHLVYGAFDALIFAGHGESDRVDLGRANGDRNHSHLFSDNSGIFSAIDQMMAADSLVIAATCSAGDPDNQDNIAAAMSRCMSNPVIIAPDSVFHHLSFNFTRDRISGVVFSCSDWDDPRPLVYSAGIVNSTK